MNIQNRSQRGFSLIELLLVLSIIAGLAIAAFIIYPKVQAGRSATYESQLLASTQASVKTLFTSGDFSKLKTKVAVDAHFFPDNMTDAGAATMSNEWGGVVTVNGSDSIGGDLNTVPTRYFKITYTLVPSAVCVKLAGAAAANFTGIRVGGAQVQDLSPAVNSPLDEGAVATNCNSVAGSATMTFISN